MWGWIGWNMFCLALSSATMVDCIQEMVRATSCDKGAALLAASHHPAKLLGLDAKKGTCQVGADADLVLLSQDLEVQATCIAGEIVWERQDSDFSKQRCS